jgi:HlyD family secretion protein
VGLTPEAVRAQLGSGGERPAGPAAAGDADADRYRFANRYWVFVQRDGRLQAVNVETGLTDLDYSEVTSGLEAGDQVVLLPSSGLVQSQQRLQERMQQFTALPGMSRSRERENQ